MNEKKKDTNLVSWGWNEAWQDQFEQLATAGSKKVEPARVTAQYSRIYQIVSESGELSAEVSGRFEFAAVSPGDYPAVGDWVAIEPLEGEGRAIIHAVLKRRSAMIRKTAGSTLDEQVVGTNLDTVFIVQSLNQDWNARRLERYLIAVRDSGSQPVVLFTKSDLCDDPTPYLSEAERIAPGVPVFAVSAITDQGRKGLAPYLKPGHTVAAVGSSGVGKSSLLNWLAGDDLQEVQRIREDDARGRHTTTHRELFRLPEGAIWLDTPGMRELQMWDSQHGWQATFTDVEELAASCRFRDCQHEKESGCAVRAALEDGSLDASRYANYRKTEREIARIARKEQFAANRLKKKGGSRDSESGRKQKHRANGAGFYDAE
ncbi:ribosome small subunit-dependent GTPase A [Cohnella sp. AR92]|uniref:ribosome small subunit-dependent GTPase A n=1 Tax=Cohnella sp. AR92 TaxID=648716 RepID=UPI000F8DBFFE|nr:ribosome small subunit-dependent GTPase A [Cohnella sp. AR92]RUS43858.1 ribosome small subunit-dependent GTPase A [Cohnella sp. AR92]